MRDFGNNTGAGFLPNVPGIEDLLNKGGILNSSFKSLENTEAGKYLHDGVESAETELKRSYSRLFSGHGNAHDAEAVIEDILDKTLRRGMFLPAGDKPLDHLMPFMLERQGNNGFCIYLLKMITDGNNLPAPKQAKAKSKKRK